jgi:hypothetical protein
MIYELREYDIAPGKMAANDKRFEEVDIVGLFEKHGMKVIGFWHTVIGENAGHRLTYILAYENLAHREATWASFGKDPTWPNKKRETDPEGNMITYIKSTIMAPTRYSPLK